MVFRKGAASGPGCGAPLVFQDLVAMVEQLARFLGVSCDKAQLESLVEEHCHQLVDQCYNARPAMGGYGAARPLGPPPPPCRRPHAFPGPHPPPPRPRVRVQPHISRAFRSPGGRKRQPKKGPLRILEALLPVSL